MATLGGQRTQFTWALNQYNSTEDPKDREKFARRMAKYLSAAPENGFTPEQVSQGKNYPAEVNDYFADPNLPSEPDITEQQAAKNLEGAVNIENAVKFGTGSGALYAYGYACAPDRLKIGYTEADLRQRIAAQISTSTPDRPSLVLEIRTDNCRALERAVHGSLEVRGKRVQGGGTEWFRTTRDEVLELVKSILGSDHPLNN
jgi:T5orf172 domain